MDQISMRHGPEGWSVRGLPSFEAFDLRGLRAVYIDGEPTLIAVDFHPIPGDHEPAAIALTPERLAAFPGRKIATTLLAFHEQAVDGEPPWVAAMRRLTDEPMVRPRGGSIAFSEEVADVIRVARQQGVNTRDAIAERWHVTASRADQYIREMRAHLGDRAPGDGRHERPHRGPRAQTPVEVVRRRRTSAPAPSDPTARSRRVRPPEESA